MMGYTPEWATAAACRPLPKEVFYSTESDTLSRARAVSACEGCSVLALCREYALEHTAALADDDDLELDFGFWALTTPEDRVQILLMRREREPRN